jgi:uncharacterized protein (TIGR03437 family)
MQDPMLGSGSSGLTPAFQTGGPRSLQLVLRVHFRLHGLMIGVSGKFLEQGLRVMRCLVTFSILCAAFSPVVFGRDASVKAGQETAIIDILPDQPLVVTFTLLPNNADMLWIVDNTGLYPSTSPPAVIGQLFDNGNLLGTFVQAQSGQLDVAFESLSSQYTSSVLGALPARVDITSLNKGTTTGCLVVSVTGGSIGVTGPIAFYDALSTSSNSFTQLNDLTVTDWNWGAPSPPALSIPAGGIVNAASYAAGSGLAPGSIASVIGTFAKICPANGESNPLPTSLSGLSMQVGQLGSGAQAPLFYVSATQVNLQIPWEPTSPSQSTLTAMLNGQGSAGQTLSVTSFSPGIFSMNSQGTGQGAILDSSYRLVDSSNPATPGTTIVLIYCTGLGAVTNQPATGSPAPSDRLAWTATTPTVTIGGAPANVQFSGLAPGYVGLYQVNAQVPAGSATGPTVPVSISIGGVASNTVTMAVR